jgi:hypothetical protein
MSAAAASKGALRAVGTFPDAEEAIGARSLRRSRAHPHCCSAARTLLTPLPLRASLPVLRQR